MRSKSPDMPDAIAGGGDKAGNGDRRDGAAEERQPPLGTRRRSSWERSHTPTAKRMRPAFHGLGLEKKDRR